ncbi:Gti1/Pac2 family-domain-containing protein [Roridomyces roridus]|uniref:Gti1/Pac2 family-domain-containing protein n=1 Tax=Roridomyces roridus TaxID=1738132 RepID=A0AAD7CC07_9AGAR|nr:Gti1/Pac2 family-domain-containing protein [Roridomyces roridus]
MSFRPGVVLEQQTGPCVTHPSLHIRDVADAHKVLEAVRLNILPLIRRRLLAHERAQLRSGNVFVWEESPDSDEGGLVRWTEGRRWSQSRMRGDCLFYEEKIDTTFEEKQAKAKRRATKASDASAVILPPPKRKDRPSKVDGLTKQTYSVNVHLPGVPTKRWHLVCYFATCDYARLPVIENYEYLRTIRVPEGVFISNRMVAGEHAVSHSDDFESLPRGSHSPVASAFERMSMSPGASSRFYTRDDGVVLAPPVSPRQGRPHSPVSLPPLASLGYPVPRPPLLHRHTTTPSSTSQQARHRLSPEDRRVLDSFRVVI